jgi:hypothetical protein
MISSICRAQHKSPHTFLHSPQLDLAFTAEGTDAAPATLSLRGLDHAAHYRANGVLNCGEPVTQDYVLRMLRHWANVSEEAGLGLWVCGHPLCCKGSL